jgi:hypothetical protein
VVDRRAIAGDRRNPVSQKRMRLNGGLLGGDGLRGGRVALFLRIGNFVWRIYFMASANLTGDRAMGFVSATKTGGKADVRDQWKFIILTELRVGV